MLPSALSCSLKISQNKVGRHHPLQQPPWGVLVEGVVVPPCGC